jgi:hypothetical protein
MDTWQNEVWQAAHNTAELTDGNKEVLAFQFEEAQQTNPDGFTMDVYGKLVKLDHGYSVGLTPDPFGDVRQAIAELARIQQQYGFQNLHLGFWRDNGRDYIDVVMVTQNQEMALILGRRMDQLAIWDFSTDSEIRLDQDGGDDAGRILPAAA